jgi:hypothetical protein
LYSERPRLNPPLKGEENRIIKSTYIPPLLRGIIFRSLNLNNFELIRFLPAVEMTENRSYSKVSYCLLPLL